MVLEFCESKVTSTRLDSDQQKLLGDFTASRTSGDERLLIWSDALKAISKQPLLGQWPTTPLLEGRDNMTYMHPHNFTLEMAIYFGWPLACVATLSILCLFFISLWLLTRTVSFVDQFISIAIIGEFLRMQFSGDLLDTLGIAILCGFLVFRFVLRIDTQSAET
jgi:O-antigen ligase